MYVLPLNNTFKIIFIGNSNVGKTWLIYRILNKSFPSIQTKSTFGWDFISITN